MHKKKHSATVLAGEMILTFYKPTRLPKAPAKRKQLDKNPAEVLSEVFDACLTNGTPGLPARRCSIDW